MNIETLATKFNTTPENLLSHLTQELESYLKVNPQLCWSWGQGPKIYTCTPDAQEEFSHELPLGELILYPWVDEDHHYIIANPPVDLRHALEHSLHYVPVYPMDTRETFTRRLLKGEQG